MKVLSIIASAVITLVPVLIFIASTRQGWKVAPTKRHFWLNVFTVNFLGLLVMLVILWLGGVFKNFC